MTFNAPTVTAIAGLGGLIYWLARRAFQLIEFLLKVILWAAQQNRWEVPDWMANQYKRLNGNSLASRQEKTDTLGSRHDSSAKREASKATMVGGDDL